MAARAARAFALAALLWAMGATGAGAQTGIYVRLEGGWSFARDAGFREDDPTPAGNCFLFVVFPSACGASLEELGSSGFVGGALGYKFLPLLRTDVSVTRRGGYRLSGCDPAGTCFNADVASWAVMANGFLDLPLPLLPFLTPFVGAGIGFAHNSLAELNWNDGANQGRLPGGKNTSFAWQLVAGAGLTILDRVGAEVAYRYADLGGFEKRAGAEVSGPPFTTGSARGELRAHELVFGLRLHF